jgi:hypothetical protein
VRQAFVRAALIGRLEAKTSPIPRYLLSSGSPACVGRLGFWWTSWMKHLDDVINVMRQLLDRCQSSRPDPSLENFARIIATALEQRLA